MSQRNALLAGVLLSVLGLAAGCSDDDENPPTTPGTPVTDGGTTPTTPTDAGVAFTQFTQNLITAQTSDTATPVDVPNTTDVKDDETAVPDGFFATP